MSPEARLAQAVIEQALRDANGIGQKSLNSGRPSREYADEAKHFLDGLRQPGNIWREMIEADL